MKSSQRSEKLFIEKNKTRVSENPDSSTIVSWMKEEEGFDV